jgi:hypothetical protein
MLGHVLVRRLVAAQRNATLLAGAQVYPVAVGFYTFSANAAIANSNLGNRV